MPALRLSQRCLLVHAATRILAALVLALGIVVVPLTATAAHADDGTSNISASINPRNNSGLDLSHYVQYSCEMATDPVSGEYMNCQQIASARIIIMDPSGFDDASEGKFTIAATSDGSFNLQFTDEGNSVCLAESSDGYITTTTCPTTGTWTLQPASDGSNYFLIRHVGDNKCLTPTPDVYDQAGTGFSTCDGGNTTQQWSITTSDGTPPPASSNAAAISLGQNAITVCNWAGYNARADIDYNIKEDASSDTETSGHYAIESFPAQQCQTATLPAGKISATVTLRRYTNFYMGDYAFSDSADGSFAGAGNNDKITAIWIIGGPHANATYHMYGTTCDSSSGFTQTSDSQAFSTQQKGQQGCEDGFSAADAGAVINTAWGVLTSLTQFF